MQLEVKYLLPTSFSGANFYIYELSEGLGIRKTVHGITMQKNPQTRKKNFWIFMHVHGVMWVQSPTCTSAHRNSINGVTNFEIVYLLKSTEK